nr:MAG TPA: hypothetical protein [Caudoviricetes sp.]
MQLTFISITMYNLNAYQIFPPRNRFCMLPD